MQSASVNKLMLFMALAFLMSALDWQASGQGQGGWYGDSSNAAPNLPKVYMEFDELLDGDSTTKEIAESLSSTFNSLWDPFWNVVVAKVINETVDLVKIGTPYKYHWLWHNNYRGHSIALWKDYKCERFFTYDSQQNSTSPWAGSSSKYSFLSSTFITSYDPSLNIWAMLYQAYSDLNLAYGTLAESSLIGFEGFGSDVFERLSMRLCLAASNNFGIIEITRASPEFYKWTVVYFDTKIKLPPI